MKVLRSISISAIVICVLSVNAFGQDAANAEPQTQKTFTISGNVGLAGVIIKGFPVQAVSNKSGDYFVEIRKGWSGIMWPYKEGIDFSPERRQFDNVNRDYGGQDFDPGPVRHVIAGSTIPPMLGVALQGLPGIPVTGTRGDYEVKVMDGWSGTVTPVKEGYRFNPPARTYENVTASMENQDFGYVSTRPEETEVDSFLDEAPVETPASYTEPIVGPTLGSSNRPDVLVIPTDNVQPGQFFVVQEDMRVMNHILRSTLEENKPNLLGDVFTDYGTFFGRNGAAFDGLYIQGYGAVFFIESDMPLTVSRAALNPSENDTPEEADSVDPVWQQARQQVLSPNRGRQRANRVQTDPDDILKKLITSLKHASNLHIDANERIIVNVLSRGTTGRGEMTGFGGRGFDNSGFGGGGLGGGGLGGGLGGGGGLGRGRSGDQYGGVSGAAESTPPEDSYGISRGMGMARRGSMRIERPASMVTIQVEKQSVDAFASGEMDFDTFRQSVDVFRY